MKNKTVKMIIAVAVLVVCCGGYAGVKTFVAKQEAKEESEEESEKTSVFTASADDIKSLDFLVDEKETTFEKKDDDWVKKDEEDFPVNQTTLSDAASALTSIESDRVLSDVDDLAEYGLDSPSNTIKITCESEKSEDKETEEKTTTLYVGDKNSSTSQYYVYKDDDKSTVYMVESSCIEPFTKTLYDYAQMEDFPVISDTDNINKITVKGDKSYELSKNTDTNLWTVKGDGDEEKADTATVSSLTTSFGSMAYNSFVDYKCKDKSTYGLDDPYAVITVDYTEEQEDTDSSDTSADSSTETADETQGEAADSEDTSDDTNASDSEESEKTVENKQLVIAVGKEADDSNRYVMVNDSDQVYTMSDDTLSALTDKAEEDFWDMTVNYVSTNDLKEVKVNYKGSDYDVNVSRETSEDDDGNEKETVTYKLDGSEVDETQFTTFYNKLINLAAQKRLTDKFKPETDPEMTVTFIKEDGNKLEAEYYSYDTNYYATNAAWRQHLVWRFLIFTYKAHTMCYFFIVFMGFEHCARFNAQNGRRIGSLDAHTCVIISFGCMYNTSSTPTHRISCFYKLYRSAIHFIFYFIVSHKNLHRKPPFFACFPTNHEQYITE